MNDKLASLQALKIDRSTPRVPTRHRYWPLFAAALLLLGGAAAGLFAFSQHFGAVRVNVATAISIARSDNRSRLSLLDATGYVVARRMATISAKIPGKLRDLLVEEGQHVKNGEVIARLDDSNTRATLAEARAQFALSEAAAAGLKPIYERSRAQLKEGLIAPETADTVKSNYDQAVASVEVQRAAVAVAEQNEQDTIVHAPFDAVVTVKAAQPGEIVSPLSAGAGFTRTGIATVVDMDSLEVEVDVNESFINRVRSGQACSVKLNAYPDWEIPAEVISAIPTADRSKATVKVRVALKTKDPRILPEMGARVSFFKDPAAARDEDKTVPGVLVPSDAIHSVNDRDGVFVVRDGVAHERPVTVVGRVGDRAFVTSGLASGEVVAVGNVPALSDGSRVAVQN